MSSDVLLGKWSGSWQRTRRPRSTRASTASPTASSTSRRVEDEEAWQVGYSSLEAFYDTQAARHPDIRLYAKVRRDIATISPVHDPGGLPSALLARLRSESASG
jgi:hypothetical protein